MTLKYTAPPTIDRFIGSFFKSRVSLVLGPIGSGKTTGMMMTLLFASTQQLPNAKGERHTRWAVVRNTRPQLKDSVIRSVRQWFPETEGSIRWHKTDMGVDFRLPLEDGTVAVSEFMFRALDDEDDAAKLLSVEYTGFWLSEFREIPVSLLTDIRSRAGRFPARVNGPGPTWYGVVGESNFPVQGTEWHDLLEAHRPAWLQLVKQPSALSAEAENRDNLPPNYYEELMQGSTESWQKAHILCEYPESNDGQAVFGKTFSRDRHVAKAPLRPITNLTAGPPVIVGVDQGRSPAALIGQLDGHGRLNIYQETFGSNMGMRKFVADNLLPVLQRRYFNTPVIVVTDPAAAHKTEVDDESPLDVLRGAGLHAVVAPTNVLSRRLEAVERLLTSHEGIIIDPSCTELLAALSFRYQYRKLRSGELDEAPIKSHPWSDLCFAAKTLLRTPQGLCPIELLVPGDTIATDTGWTQITHTLTHNDDTMIRLHLSSGRAVDCTAGHPFAIRTSDGVSFVPAACLTPSDRLLKDGQWPHEKDGYTRAGEQFNASARSAAKPFPPRHGAWHRAKQSTARSVADIWAAAARAVSKWTVSGLAALVAVHTSGASSATALEWGAANRSTGTSGHGSVAAFLRSVPSTTSTTTQPTTTSLTLSASHSASTRACTVTNASLRGRLGCLATSLKRALLQLRGTEAPKGVDGRARHHVPSPLQRHPSSAALQGSEAQHRAKAVSCPPKSIAAAASPLSSCGTSVVRVERLPAATVYSLTTKAHTFYAEGVLVHNCDCLQYLALSAGGVQYGRVLKRIRPGNSDQPKAPRASAAGWT